MGNKQNGDLHSMFEFIIIIRQLTLISFNNWISLEQHTEKPKNEKRHKSESEAKGRIVKVDQPNVVCMNDGNRKERKRSKCDIYGLWKKIILFRRNNNSTLDRRPIEGFLSSKNSTQQLCSPRDFFFVPSFVCTTELRSLWSLQCWGLSAELRELRERETQHKILSMKTLYKR